MGGFVSCGVVGYFVDNWVWDVVLFYEGGSIVVKGVEILFCYEKIDIVVIVVELFWIVVV